MTFQLVLQDGCTYTVTRDETTFPVGPAHPLVVINQAWKPELAKVMQACSYISGVMNNAQIRVKDKTS